MPLRRFVWSKSCLSRLLLQGAVITPAAAIEPSLSIHPSGVMAPLAQQMNHLSLGTTGTVRLHSQIF